MTDVPDEVIFDAAVASMLEGLTHNGYRDAVLNDLSPEVRDGVLAAERRVKAGRPQRRTIRQLFGTD